MARHPRALGADRLLGDLHHHLVAFIDDVGDRHRPPVLELGDVNQPLGVGQNFRKGAKVGDSYDF